MHSIFFARFISASPWGDPDAPPLFCLPRQPRPLLLQQQRRQQPVPPLPLRVHPPQNPRCAQDPSCHVVPRRARGRRAQLSPRARAGRWRRQGRPRRRRRGTRGAEVVGPRVARRAPPADAWGGEDTLPCLGVVTGLVVSLLCCRPADGIHGSRCHDDAMFFFNLYMFRTLHY